MPALTPDGVSLFTTALGPESEIPLVVLHGGPSASHEYLLPEFARLAVDRRVVLYDQRGGGRSRTTPDQDLGFGAHVNDVSAVIGSMGAAQVDLCGYSFGGLVAMMFAVAEPQRVRRLVLASSAPPWYAFREPLARALAGAQASPWVIEERAALERSGLRETMPEEYRRRRFSLSVAGYFADPRLAYGLTPFKVQARAAELVLHSLGDYDFRDRVKTLDGRRVLVIHGDRDPIDYHMLQETARSMNARFVLLTNSGHVPYLEASESFFSIVRAFLSETGDP